MGILRTIKGFDENLLAMKIFRVFAAFALADAAAMGGGMMDPVPEPGAVSTGAPAAAPSTITVTVPITEPTTTYPPPTPPATTTTTPTTTTMAPTTAAPTQPPAQSGAGPMGITFPLFALAAFLRG